MTNIDGRSDHEFCGFCGHHADPHDYSATGVEVPCTECPNGICPRKAEDPWGEAFDLFEAVTTR
jgi:NADH pyrophosphatase NudC (nudix superfamily)